MAFNIESLTAARLFVVPQLCGERIFFLSNLTGHLSLYAMNYGGSVPEPLLPTRIALQNPHLIGGGSFVALPAIGKVLVMIDAHGDENYQPMIIPWDGGFPEPAFDGYFSGYRVHLAAYDLERSLVYFSAERRDRSLNETYRGDLRRNKLTKLDESPWGAYPAAFSTDHKRVLITEGYTMGDAVLFLLDGKRKKVLLGKPLSQRAPEERVPLTGLRSPRFSPSEKGVLLVTALFEDTYSLGYVSLADPGAVGPVRLRGVVHSGVGELVGLEHLKDDRYALVFNIDGCSWLYEGVFDEEKRVMKLKTVVVGTEPLDQGTLEHADYNRVSDVFTLSFSTAAAPTQIYTVEGRTREQVVQHTNERLLGIDAGLLAAGEDASFTSFDGLRVSARLYLPSDGLGYQVPYPLVYYIHGGPQGQERPDFAWFSMPLIQHLTLRGFAVFVPNVRGSTGYGITYTKQVDRDWGGQDRLDHVHAMKEILPRDMRLDLRRAAVVGRSYGGYMTLTLAGRHPELWRAACDMFGPYDLLTFLERIPETWKPYYRIALGDPANARERDFLVERSPKSHLSQLACPLLVIQGRNDPRVVARESEDLVHALRSQGKQVDLLIFEDEGHDVLKYENRVRCYNTIADFFSDQLKD